MARDAFRFVLRIITAALIQHATAQLCPRNCVECDETGNCLKCREAFKGTYCDVRPQLTRSETVCGVGCEECCFWEGFTATECITYTNKTQNNHPCRIPPINDRTREGEDDGVYSAGNKPQGPMIGLFLLFFMFVMLASLREYCQRRTVQDPSQANDPPPLTHTVSESNTNRPAPRGPVVVVLGPSGEVEVGVKELELKQLPPSGEAP